MADLITLDEAEEHVKAGGTMPAGQRALLPEYITTASRIIEHPDLAGPVVQEERTVTFDGGRSTYVLPDVAATVTAVTVDGTALSSDSWTANTRAGIVRSEAGAFASGWQNVVITYTAGSLDPVPANLKLACKILVAWLWQTTRQGARRDMDGVTYVAGFAVPNQVVDLCRPDSMPVGFA